MTHYTYLLYGEDRRFYYGVRSCQCPPEKDRYWGSFSDKSFVPIKKRILAVFSTREQALKEEIRIHALKNVDTNPKYANRAKQKSDKFYFSASGPNNPNFGGGHLTAENVLKISETTRRRLLSSPETNPFCQTGEKSMSFNRRWVTNIEKTEEKYLKSGEEAPEGWISGRKKRPPRSQESRQRTSRALKGKLKSEEHKRKLSDSLSKYYLSQKD